MKCKFQSLLDCCLIGVVLLKFNLIQKQKIIGDVIKNKLLLLNVPITFSPKENYGNQLQNTFTLEKAIGQIIFIDTGHNGHLHNTIIIIFLLIIYIIIIIIIIIIMLNPLISCTYCDISIFICYLQRIKFLIFPTRLLAPS